jgi:serine/threonine protein kinase
MNEREIFEKAIEIQNPAQRQAFLDQACGGDATLRAQLDQLLASHQQASQFLNVPLVDQLSPPAKEPVQPTIELSSSSGVAAGRPMNAPHPDDEDDELYPGPDLSFLQPSTTPGSLGRLGHYEILQVLGQGAFGIVFKAFDEKLHRHVAVKAMTPQLASTSPPRKRFLREARSVAALKHENIVQIYSVEEQPLPYLAMEFVDGQTLQQKLDGSGPLEVPEILHLGRQMAAGLAAAHDKGLIHRDIKPGNILIEAGAEQKVKITDFGLARAADDATMTRTGTIAGTPMYMAPEQALGQTLDHRADLFSLGSVLYQMTCGRPPFRGANALAVLKRVIDETPRPIQDILPQVPDWLCAIIAKLQARQPEDRFQSAREVADLLGRCQASLQQLGRVELPGDLGAFLPKPDDETKSKAVATGYAREKPAVLPPARRPGLRWTAAAVVLIALVGGVSLTEATGVTNIRATVIRLFSPDRTLAVKVDDPGVSVSIDGEEMVITGTARQSAEWVLEVGGTLVLRREGTLVHLKQGDNLPNTPFEIYAVSLYGVQELRNEDINRLQFLPTVRRGLNLTHNRKLGDAGFVKLAAFPGFAQIEQLEVHDTGVGETGLEQIPRFKKLTILNLSGPAVTKNVLARLRRMELKNVTLYECHNAGDDAMAELVALPALEQLVLSHVPISDTGLMQLAMCKALRSLMLTKCAERAGTSQRTPITGAGVKRLATALPQCRIEWDGVVIEPTVVVDPDRRAAEWVLSIGGTVRVNSQEQFIKTTDELPKESFRLTAVNLTNHQKITEEGLTLFQDCRNVSFLGLVGPGVTDAGLANFRNCKDLTTLILAGAPVTDAGLMHFKGKEKLIGLDLYDLPVTDAGLANFKDCRDLATLRLDGTRVTDAGLANFKDCKKLYTLLLNTTQVTDAGLAHFKDCKNFGWIHLAETQVTATGLAYFKGCKSPYFDLRGTPMDDAGLKKLAGITNLLGVNLRMTKVTPMGIDELRNELPKCRIEWDGGVIEPTVAADPDRRAAEWVLANGGKVQIGPGGDVFALDKLPTHKFTLGVVSFDGLKFQEESELKCLAQLAHLQHVYLGQAPITGLGLGHIATCPELVTLALDSTSVRDGDLGVLKNLKKLQNLSIHNTRTTDAAINHIWECPHLTQLDLSLTGITDAGLKKLEGLAGLQFIQVYQTKVSAAGVNEFAAALPGCKIRWDGGVIEPKAGQDKGK